MRTFMAGSKRWGSRSTEQEFLFSEHAGFRSDNFAQFIARLTVMAFSATISNEDRSLKTQHSGGAETDKSAEVSQPPPVS